MPLLHSRPPQLSIDHSPSLPSPSRLSLSPSFASPLSLPLLPPPGWTASNLVRNKPTPDLDEVEGVVQAMCTMAGCTKDEDALLDCLWGMSYISEPNEGSALLSTLSVPVSPSEVAEKGGDLSMVEMQPVARLLVKCLSHHSPQVVTPALRVVGNLASGEEDCVDQLLEEGALEGLFELVTKGKRGTKKESLWALSNIAAGTEAQARQLLDAGVLQLAPGFLQEAKDVMGEGIWLLANLSTHKMEAYSTAL